MVDVSAEQSHPMHVADFSYAGKRVVAFLASDGPGAVNTWPQAAENYAAGHGFGPSDARWYELRPQRFVNGRPHLSEYRLGDGSWRFETDMDLAREIVKRLGLDPDTLPLDI